MNHLRDLPEVVALDEGRSVVRLPAEIDAPITPRVRAVIDSAPFRRLAGVSQTGLVALIYPGSRHHRFEHSLGVYRLALLFLKHLAHDERFRATVTVADAERFILAALLHDVGHWPFCHPIEDMGLPGIPRHETQAAEFLTTGDLADVIKNVWRHDPRDVWRLLDEPPASPAEKLLQSLLSGPIDIDKMDYLTRDSL
ncbi:MAG TPA: HD domain-containing protein, partial [Pirellulales bacterium]